ncbi:MAG TPA: tRNA dihydrouridine synthase DusB [Phycisphaerae bacterium]|nr:tRNA dihydrouridine synthase DusB [Phycisphaerae bacterium]
MSSNLLLAPISGYCDLAFRLTIRPLGGLGLACTDLVNPQGVLRNAPQSMEILRTEPGDHPLCVQLYGREPHAMAEAARWCRDHGADVLDINMGCPAVKITRHGAGAALLREPALALRIAEAVVRAVDLPVTVKMRLGWDCGSVIAPRLAADFEQAGVAGLIVHGRTADQHFRGRVDLDGIRRVVEAARSIPVVGNGDVCSPRDAKAMIGRTGCAGVMIGRGALGNPWIFRDTQVCLTTGTVPSPPSTEERLAFMWTHFEHLMRLRGERTAVSTFRQRASWYVPHLGHCPVFRQRVRFIASASEFRNLLDAFPCGDPAIVEEKK